MFLYYTCKRVEHKFLFFIIKWGKSPHFMKQNYEITLMDYGMLNRIEGVCMYSAHCQVLLKQK